MGKKSVRKIMQDEEQWDVKSEQLLALWVAVSASISFYLKNDTQECQKVRQKIHWELENKAKEYSLFRWRPIPVKKFPFPKDTNLDYSTRLRL